MSHTTRSIILFVFGIVVATATPTRPTTLRADSGIPSLALVAEFGGLARAAVAEGNRVYVAVHSRVIVLDGAEPEAGGEGMGRALGESNPTGHLIRSLAVSDGYVIAVGDVLVVFDARSPETIREIGRVTLRHSANSIAWVGDTAYLGSGRHGITPIDLSDLHRPRELPPWRPVDRAPSGDAAFYERMTALDPSRLLALIRPTVGIDRTVQLIVADVEQAGDPRLISSSEIAFAGHRSPWGLSMAASPSTVAISGADGTIDLIPLDETGRLGESRTVTGLPNYVGVMAIRHSVLWAYAGGLWRIDLTDASAESVADTSPLSVLAPMAMLNVGSLLFVLGTTGSDWVMESGATQYIDGFGARWVHPVHHAVTAPDGVWAVGYGDPVSRIWQPPRGEWALSGTDLVPHFDTDFDVNWIASREGRLYLLQQDHLVEATADIHGATHVHGMVPLGEHAARRRLGMLGTTGDHLIVRATSHDAGQPHYVQILSRPSDSPDTLTEIAIEYEDDVLWATVAGSLAWLTVRRGGSVFLEGYELSSLDRPTRVTTGFALPRNTFRQFAISDDAIAVAGGSDLLLFDVSAPDSPQLRGGLDFPGGIRVVMHDNNGLLWVCWHGGLSAVNISNLDHPKEALHHRLDTSPRTIAASEGLLWMVSSTSVVQAFDIRDSQDALTRLSLPWIGVRALLDRENSDRLHTPSR